MASLPSVAVGNTILQLEPELRRHSSFFPSEKKSFNKKFTHLDKALDFREALSVIRDGTKVESSIYVPLLQECIDQKTVDGVHCIHGHIIKTGSYEDVFVTTFLVNVYAKCGTMEDARKVFDNLPTRNVVSWTALMTGYVHNAQPEIAIRVFREMLEVGAYPTNYTLGIVLNACSLLSYIGLGKQIHGYVIKYQAEFDTSIGNTLCSLYSKLGILNYAVKAFQNISEKNVISWTTILSACGANGFYAMGLDLFIQMLSEGVEPNEFTLTTVLSLCCTMKALGVGSQVHSLAIRLGYELNLPVMNSIMYLYLKCGWIDKAKVLFDRMETLSLITWNAMIAGYAQTMNIAKDNISAHHNGVEALNIFLRLNRSEKKPDLFTFSSILTVCSSLVALEQGEQVHAQTLKAGFLSDLVVGTALVNMYSKCGSIERASKAFIEIPTRTMISWTSMLTAFSQHGLTQQTLQLFEDMRIAGIRPNQITFVAVLSACSHAGMVDEAFSYFETMKQDYKIKPVMDHYACMVDMYVRLGRLDEALDFIKKMDFEPNAYIWSILIAGCRSHGNSEIGCYAAEQFLNLNPKDAETYVFCLDMFLQAGRETDVSRVRKMMGEEIMRKLRDWSWINIRNKVHSFEPCVLSNPPSEEVEKLLGDLLEKAKNLGYEEEAQGHKVLTDEDDQDVASSLSAANHSEKLAVAFGLLNTPNAAPVRVIKSISMCRDCHNFIKFVSVETAREIIIRDSKRLHKFVNGLCSCGDFPILL